MVFVCAQLAPVVDWWLAVSVSVPAERRMVTLPLLMRAVPPSVNAPVAMALNAWLVALVEVVIREKCSDRVEAVAELVAVIAAASAMPMGMNRVRRIVSSLVMAALGPVGWYWERPAIFDTRSSESCRRGPASTTRARNWWAHKLARRWPVTS